MLVVGKPVGVPASGSVARISMSLRLSGRVKEILRRERFDVIHLHEPLMPTLPITVLRFSETINVGTFHAYNARTYSRSTMGYYYGKRILKRWFRKLHGKIAVSKPALTIRPRLVRARRTWPSIGSASRRSSPRSIVAPATS